MFSGIVEDSAEVLSLSQDQFPYRLRINTKLDLEDVSLGDSICVSGVCLTVVARKGRQIEFDLLQETVLRSSLGRLKKSDQVNIERSLKLGDRLHGHFLFGHVDTTVRLLSRVVRGKDSERFCFSLPKRYHRYVVPKGSVGISGVSLTVGEVLEERFSVYLIPHTLAVTSLGSLRVGQIVNLEIDMLARYALAEQSPASTAAVL